MYVCTKNISADKRYFKGEVYTAFPKKYSKYFKEIEKKYLEVSDDVVETSTRSYNKIIR